MTPNDDAGDDRQRQFLDLADAVTYATELGRHADVDVVEIEHDGVVVYLDECGDEVTS